MTEQPNQYYAIYTRPPWARNTKVYVTVSDDNDVTDIDDPRVALMGRISARHKVLTLRRMGIDASWTIYRPAWKAATGQNNP